MFTGVRVILLPFVVAVMGGPAAAAWLTIRNDTKHDLIVQDVVVVNGRPQQGRAVKLQPGEAIREHKPAPGSRGIWVFDPAKPKTPLLVGTLKWDKDDVTFTLKSDTQSVDLAIVPPKKP